jgi:D-glycero-alpha-D-manno-heptose 1-phosphate guanylyltransferase
MISPTLMQSFEDVTVVVLAGGLGTRLRSVVGDQPKVLAQVQGRPFLSYLLDHLAVSGLNRVVLCTGYRGEQLRNVFGSSYKGLELFYSQEPAPAGTGGALRLALPMLESESVLIMNGDSFCSADLKAFWRWHCVRDAMGSLLLTEMPDTERYGCVRTDDQGMVQSFEEKGSNRGPGWINAGVYLLKTRLLESIPQDRPVSLECEMFPLWAGRELYGYRFKGPFLDIGTPESYLLAEEFSLHCS